ncbi:laminin subunit gamma-1-like [Cherax quadricarinatus]|uniref:laminin subunit gamma-1-like n=1 Tax=Cherax quadricarinatus TaxID=27406 RepID=UPI00387EAB96
MADRQGRRVNTVCVAFTQGSLSVSTMHTVMPCIIRDVYGIPNEELYGVALNGMSRMFIKFVNAGFYNKIVETFQERRMVVNSAVEVCLHDVSTYVTWVKVRNVSFEVEEYDLRDVFGRYGTVHAATKGVWREGPYEGFPEGSFTIKMTLRQSIPSYVRLEKYRTQVFVHYAGQRKTCKLCNSFEHMAAQCPRQLVVHSRDHSPVGLRAEAFVTEPGTSAGQVPRLWSDEMQHEDTLFGSFSHQATGLVDVQAQIEETSELKNRGWTQHQVTAELLSDTSTAEGQASNAIKKAEKTLTEAKNTLTVLEGFDKQVQESRGEALNALVRVAEIEKLIGEAEARTLDAEEALVGAESDAKNARDIAKEAQKTASDASKEAGDVRIKADATKDEASSLKDEADQLASRVAGTDSTVSTYESQADDDHQQVMEAQERANQAKDRTDIASAKVREAYEVVQEILDILERSPDLDPSQLENLEQHLEEAWQTYYQSGVETTVTELLEARSWQERQISLYEEEIRRLQIEVVNIEEIKISLPDGCYSQTKLEP